MKSKVCSSCGENKTINGYYVNEKKHGKVYYKSQCKTCVLLSRQKFYKSHRDSKLNYNKKYYQENAETLKDKQKVWRDANLPSRLSRNSKRRALKLKASITLTEEQEAQIKQFYWLAKDLQSVTGEQYHVDHIVPLQGENVCGLHVPWNLQVLPADINLSKGNSYADYA